MARRWWAALGTVIGFAITLPAAWGIEREDPEVARLARDLSDQALDLAVERERRLVTIADRIRLEGAELCRREDQAPVLGLGLIYRPWLGLGYAAALARYARDDGVTVSFVVPGHAADAAGIEPGDVILRVQGNPPKDPRNVLERSWSERLEPKPLKLVIARDGEILDFEIESRMGCRFPAYLKQNDTVNAWTDGERLIFTSGMMRYATDAEIALVVGHEIAHAMLHHIARRARGPEFEAEADYMGLYLTARAAFPIDGVTDFWRRYGLENVASLRETSHPSPPSRVLALEAAVREIEAKRESGVALEPDLR